MSKKVLVVSGHPDLKNDSLANKTILKEIKKLYPEVELDILSNLYPDYQINVTAEQENYIELMLLFFSIHFTGT